MHRKKQRTKNKEQRTKNKEQRTEKRAAPRQMITVPAGAWLLDAAPDGRIPVAILADQQASSAITLVGVNRDAEMKK